MKKRIIILLTLFFAGYIHIYAQKIDEEKMTRDIEVAEKILESILDLDSKNAFFRSNIEGSYIEDFGVVLNVPSYYFRAQNSRKAILRGFESVRVENRVGDNKIVYIERPDGDSRTLSTTSQKKNIYTVDLDSLNDVRVDEMIEKVKIFLTDYAQLIGQLSDKEKVVVTNAQNSNGNVWMNAMTISSDLNSNQVSISVSAGDVRALESGKISKNQLMERVEVNIRNRDDEIERDLELFSTVISRLFKEDLSKTYYTPNDMAFQKWDDLGVVYRMKVYSTMRDGEYHRIVTTGQGSLTQLERDEIVKAMYPQFLSSLKESVLDYGKMITSLEEDERVIIQVALTECRGCGIPEKIELSISNEVLQNYAADKVSRNTALEKFTLNEGDLQ